MVGINEDAYRLVGDINRNHACAMLLRRYVKPPRKASAFDAVDLDRKAHRKEHTRLSNFNLDGNRRFPVAFPIAFPIAVRSSDQLGS